MTHPYHYHTNREQCVSQSHVISVSKLKDLPSSDSGPCSSFCKGKCRQDKFFPCLGSTSLFVRFLRSCSRFRRYEGAKGDKVRGKESKSVAELFKGRNREEQRKKQDDERRNSSNGRYKRRRRKVLHLISAKAFIMNCRIDIRYLRRPWCSRVTVPL